MHACCELTRLQNDNDSVISMHIFRYYHDDGNRAIDCGRDILDAAGTTEAAKDEKSLLGCSTEMATFEDSVVLLASCSRIINLTVRVNAGNDI